LSSQQTVYDFLGFARQGCPAQTPVGLNLAIAVTFALAWLRFHFQDNRFADLFADLADARW
jgi:hypothetical protein